MELIKSSVVFDSENHTYTLNGKRLSGITSLLDRQLFKDKYSGIPEEILRKAAERGTFIHQCCELVDEGFPSSCVESDNYLALKEKFKLNYEESEYLVSDNENYASCIDKVYRYSDNTFFLGDIKTTYKLNKEFVQWQLSIYAYLFELQNPGAVVSSVFAIWLRGDTHQIVELDRIPIDRVKALLEADSKGLQFEEKCDSLPVLFNEIEDLIVNIEAQLKSYTEQKKALTEGCMRAMVQSGLYSWKGERVSITRKTASTRKVFDKESFEKDYPGVYDKYIKETPVSESLTFKVK